MIITFTILIGFAYLLSMQGYKAYKDYRKETMESLRDLFPMRNCRYKPHPKYRIVTRY